MKTAAVQIEENDSYSEQFVTGSKVPGLGKMTRIIPNPNPLKFRLYFQYSATPGSNLWFMHLPGVLPDTTGVWSINDPDLQSDRNSHLIVKSRAGLALLVMQKMWLSDGAPAHWGWSTWPSHPFDTEGGCYGEGWAVDKSTAFKGPGLFTWRKTGPIF
jgi:hypothetical protein